MLLLLGAFIAGIITVFAPCVLPLLPIIIGGSLTGNVQDKRRPIIIAASLAISLFLFTFLLKATTLLVDIPPQTITYVSGGIIIILGLFLLFPNLYERLILTFNLQAKSQQLLGKSGGKGAVIGAIITGAALGPVFSSCSPVYAYILATILPANFGAAMLYITAYIIGLSAMLLLIGFLGQKFVRRLKFASNPRGWFQRIMAILFIIVGLLVITGYDKRVQTYVSENTPFNFDAISAKLIPASNQQAANGVLNVKPYKAPEFVGLENWINSEPLKLEALKGKVVLVDFWTYSCINCIRTQPYLKDWNELYGKNGDFEVIGIHAPEFAFERNPANVKDAVQKAGLGYPVALDNNFATWNAYENRYWPGTYLIDKEGNVRRVHGGEGEYKQTEEAIRMLLQEGGGRVPVQTTKALSGTVPVSERQTPETYLGTKRASNYTGSPSLTQGEKEFSPGSLGRVNQWTLGGTWKVDSEGITAVRDSVLKFRFAAKEVYVVTGNANENAEIEVLLNGQLIDAGNAGSDVVGSSVKVTDAQLYKLVKLKGFSMDSTLELRIDPGVRINVFTFGS